MEKKDKEEAFMNEPDEEEKSVDYMNNKLAGGMNRPKDTFPKVSDGDNPMKKNKFESGDLRAQIRAELQQRLAESKTAQLDEGPLDMLKKAGGAVKGAFKGAVTGAKKAMATPGGGTARSKQAFGKVVKAPAGGVGVSPAGGVGVSPAQTPGAQSAQTQQPSPGRKQAADALIGLASTLQSGKTSSGADYGLDDIATDLEDLAKDMRENPQDYDSVAKSGGVK
jgi:hypothetical protein